MCSQRNCPVCSLKPIICLSSGRLLASNRLLGNGVYIIMWTATRERDAILKRCLAKALPASVQISSAHIIGQLLWKKRERVPLLEKGDKAEMFDYSYISPVELIFSQKLWRVLIFLLSSLCDPAVGAVCYPGNACGSHCHRWLELSLVRPITPTLQLLSMHCNWIWLKLSQEHGCSLWLVMFHYHVWALYYWSELI